MTTIPYTTSISPLDKTLSGGFRRGQLVYIAGPGSYRLVETWKDDWDKKNADKVILFDKNFPDLDEMKILKVLTAPVYWFDSFGLSNKLVSELAYLRGQNKLVIHTQEDSRLSQYPRNTADLILTLSPQGQYKIKLTILKNRIGRAGEYILHRSTMRLAYKGIVPRAREDEIIPSLSQLLFAPRSLGDEQHSNCD